MEILSEQSSKHERLRTMHLFAGAGGGILADLLLGHQPICAVENNEYCQQVLSQRQKDGQLPFFPIFSDVQEFDGKPWRGLIDVVAGGFPCQDISSAGRGEGITGSRSSMWGHMARIIGEVRPRYAFVENSPMLTTRGLGTVLADLASLGYDVAWGCISAGSVGANHERNRIWIVAGDTNLRSKSGLPVNDEASQLQKLCGVDVSDSNLPQCERGGVSSGVQTKNAYTSNSCWWQDTSELHRVDDGVASRLDRLKAIGNGQVPIVAAKAWSILLERLTNSDNG